MTVLAPQADKVRMTESPNDVANCKAVGNLDDIGPAPLWPGADPAGQVNYENRIRNQTVGFGGNTAFLTFGSAIAYLCPLTVGATTGHNDGPAPDRTAPSH